MKNQSNQTHEDAKRESSAPRDGEKQAATASNKKKYHKPNFEHLGNVANLTRAS
jgi:hypothetical protein